MVAEIVFAMQLLQAELNSMDAHQVQKEHDKKKNKVRNLHIIALVCIILTVSELIGRFFLHDYEIGEFIFVS